MPSLHTPSLAIVGTLGVLLGAGLFLVLGFPKTERESEISSQNNTEAKSSSLRENFREALAADRNAETKDAGFFQDPMLRRESAAEVELTQEEALRLIQGSSRLDQIRAIEFLKKQGTREAGEILIANFLATRDKTLAALLEEAILNFDLDLLPALQTRFLNSQDPQEQKRLAAILPKIADRNPALKSLIVRGLIDCLKLPANEARQAAAGALAALGADVLNDLLGVFGDPSVDPKVAESAAWVLTQLDPSGLWEIENAIRETGTSLLKMMENPNLSEEQRENLRKKAASFAWAAVNRPKVEHDRYVPMLLENLLLSQDKDFMENLAWGIVNLQGMSAATCLETEKALIHSLASCEDAEIRQTRAWTIANLATFYSRGDRPLGSTFYQILEMTETALEDPALPASIKQQFGWIQRELRNYEQKQKAKG